MGVDQHDPLCREVGGLSGRDGHQRGPRTQYNVLNKPHFSLQYGGSAAGALRQLVRWPETA